MCLSEWVAVKSYFFVRSQINNETVSPLEISFIKVVFALARGNPRAFVNRDVTDSHRSGSASSLASNNDQQKLKAFLHLSVLPFFSNHKWVLLKLQLARVGIAVWRKCCYIEMQLDTFQFLSRSLVSVRGITMNKSFESVDTFTTLWVGLASIHAVVLLNTVINERVAADSVRRSFKSWWMVS